MCDRYAADRVLDILLGDCDEAETSEFEGHAEQCESCRRAVDELSVVARLREAKPIAPSNAADVAIRAYLTLHVHKKPTRTHRPVSAPNRFAWMSWAGAACAVAAAVVLAVVLGTRERPASLDGERDASPGDTNPSTVPMTIPDSDVDREHGSDEFVAVVGEGADAEPQPTVTPAPDRRPVADVNAPRVDETEDAQPVVAAVPEARPEQPYDHDAERRFTCAFAKIDGTIKFRRTGDANWMKAVARVPLLEGDEIDARFGAARIDIDGGSVVYVNRSTRFTVGERSADEQRLLLEMSAGDIYVGEAAGTVVSIRTPHGTARPVGTRYAVMCRSTMTSVIVRDGAVAVHANANNDGDAKSTVRVGTGEVSVVRKGRVPSTPAAANVTASLSWLRSVKRGFGPRRVRPSTVAFQHGVAPSEAYTGSVDTYLVERHPALSYGRIDFAVADGPIRGKASDASMRALLKWDVDAIAADSIILSAKITLSAREKKITGRYDAIAMKQPWLENGSSWTNRSDGSAWQQAGAKGGLDVGAVLATSSKTDGRECVFEFGPEGIALLQRWVDAPSTNLGLVIADRRNSWPLTFDTRESKDASRRPRLEVTYLAIEGSADDAE